MQHGVHDTLLQRFTETLLYQAMGLVHGRWGLYEMGCVLPHRNAERKKEREAKLTCVT
jgi:hypothetical protein